MVWWVLILVVLAAMAYVRLAPSDPAQWNRASSAPGLETRQTTNGYLWREVVAGSGKDQLRALDRIVMDTARTSRLAGSVQKGQITYVTRSAVFGFPDYTTIGVHDGTGEDAGQRYLEVYGRARFGRSDLGVNAKRIKGWLREFEAGG